MNTTEAREQLKSIRDEVRRDHAVSWRVLDRLLTLLIDDEDEQQKPPTPPPPPGVNGDGDQKTPTA